MFARSQTRRKTPRLNGLGHVCSGLRPASDNGTGPTSCDEGDRTARQRRMFGFGSFDEIRRVPTLASPKPTPPARHAVTDVRPTGLERKPAAWHKLSDANLIVDCHTH